MASGTCIKNKSAPSEEAKARKKANSRKKRAQERISLGKRAQDRISLGVKKLKLKGLWSLQDACMKGDDCPYDHELSRYPCNNFMTKCFCHRGDSCLFSHKVNISISIDLFFLSTRVSSSPPFLKPSSQSNKRKPFVAPKGMSFLSFDKTPQEEDTLKPSLGSKQKTQNSDKQSLKQSQQRSYVPLVPPKGISFLSYGLKERASSLNVKTTPNSHIHSSLNSAMKLAAESNPLKLRDAQVIMEKL
ncbi:hypothetical protein Bca4012_011135 [Brassica carinata]